jgi:hypothetical protein
MSRRSGLSAWAVFLIVCPALVVLTLVSIAGPTLRKDRRYVAELSALADIKTLQTDEVQYFAQHRQFACSLAALNPSGDWTRDEKDGYRFTLTCVGDSYRIAAAPVAFNVTGTRTFFSDASRVVHENDGPEPATVNSKIVGTR